MKWTLLAILLAPFICCCMNGAASHHHHHHDEKHENRALQFTVRMMGDLHHTAGHEENIVISPISIMTALLVVQKAAAGKTQEELNTYLNIPNSPVAAERRSKTISQALKQIMKKEQPSFTESNLAAGMFVQKDFPIRPEFVEAVQKDLPATISNVDFSGDAATETINKYVSNATRGRINPLIASPLDPATQMVLVTALYFHGVWKESFHAANTKPEKFYTGVKDIEVPLMNNKKFFLYYDDSKLQFHAVQLPYKDDFYMSIVLPYESQSLMNFTHHVTAEDLNKAMYNATETGIDCKIPRMKFSWSKSLKEVLEKEGLHSMFEKADFSNLTPSNTISVSDIIHAAEMEVDEEGTKASAATAVNFVTYSLPLAPQNPKEFYVNRPFWLTIYYRPAKVVLFSAFVHNPNGNSA